MAISNIFFWQNCISPHQIAYIKKIPDISENYKAYLIVPTTTLKERELLGWNINFLKINSKLNIIVSPEQKKIIELFSKNTEDSIHLFSGIRGDAFVFNCFKISLKYELKRGIIVEAPYIYKYPLFIHKIRFLFQDYKYIKKIDFVFAIGQNAFNYYTFWSKIWKVIPFAYCVENNNIVKQTINKGIPKIVFIGNLIPRKNVKLLLKSVSKLNVKYKLDIIGDGPEFDKLTRLKNRLNLADVNFLGKMKMVNIYQILSNYDILVLPSKHDGWGAVINEALMAGVFVICSNNCGGKDLIDNKYRGLIYKTNSTTDLSKKLNNCCVKIDTIRDSKYFRYKWSEHISGSSLSQYFMKCLFHNSLIVPPWKSID
jgi:glycosyltransferase involved in cell wall biosynthesis